MSDDTLGFYAKEGVSLEGEFNVFLDYGKGKELFFKKKNLITLAPKRFILSTLYTAGIQSDPIINLQVGTGGTIDPAGLYPKIEDPNQTGLITPILTVSCSNVPDIPNVIVKFLADVDNSQANGSLITEAGLFKLSGNIFNVKNHPGIPKTSDFSIHYEWNIKIQ